MEKEQIQDLAIQFANEGLDADHQVVYDAWILTSSDSEKNIFTEMVDLCADISVNGMDLTQIEIPTKVKDNLLAKIDTSTHDDGVKLIREEDQEWINLPVKGGAKWLELSARKEDGFVMSMIEVKPGTGFFPGCAKPSGSIQNVRMMLGYRLLKSSTKTF